MATLEVQRLKLAEAEKALRVFGTLNDLTNPSSSGLCLSVSADSLEDLRLILGNEVFGIEMFGWCAVEPKLLAQRGEMACAKSLWMEADGIRIEVTEDLERPLYNWNERASGKSNVSIARELRARGDEQVFREVLGQAGGGLGISVPEEFVKGTISQGVGQPILRLTLRGVEESRGVQLGLQVAEALGGRDLTCSCRFQSEYGRIASLAAEGAWKLRDFPIGVHPTTFFRGSFGVEPLGLLRCVPNTGWMAAQGIVERAWKRKERMNCFMLGREFVEWNVSGAKTARSQGNFLKLWCGNGRVQIQVGVEQFSPKDPPIKLVVAGLQQVIGWERGELR